MKTKDRLVKLLIRFANDMGYYHPPEKEINLGDGFVLKHEGHGVWKVFSGENLAASFIVNYYKGSSIPALRDAHAWIRGKGLGRKVIKILATQEYGHLRSSHEGNNFGT